MTTKTKTKLKTSLIKILSKKLIITYTSKTNLCFKTRCNRDLLAEIMLKNHEQRLLFRNNKEGFYKYCCKQEEHKHFIEDCPYEFP